MINALFGYGLYAAFLYIRVPIFVAQIVAHVCGMAFNYFMFRSHVFKDSQPAVIRYIGAYTVNYFISLGFLATFHVFVASGYISGFLSIVATSIVNYVVLKYFVFATTTERP